jgi:hypothetical protein
MGEEIKVRLPSRKEIGGTHPLVLIGPNGSGKTRFGANLSKTNRADWIGALRNVQIEQEIPMQLENRANQDLLSQLHSAMDAPWRLSNEITTLLAKLKAQDSDSAVKYRDSALHAEPGPPEETSLMKLSKLWAEIFPGRNIDFSSYSPKVKSTLGVGRTPYPLSTMSDGERAAVYLAARVIDASSKVIVIDEPEVHFHTRLAKLFWDKLEEIRSDCRFVYITHDLTFAISRLAAQYLIIRQPNEEPEIVSTQSGLPEEMLQSILGAASFSVYASRIVFCEGGKDHSRDEMLYRAWFNEKDFCVFPVGSCESVVKCTDVFNSSPVVRNVSATGIVDKDYWPEVYAKRLPEGVFVLPVHEVENILCIPGVFKAVAKHIPIENPDERHAAFFEKAKKKCTVSILNREILERFKRRIQVELGSLPSTLKMSEDIEELKRNCLSIKEGLNIAINHYFEEERTYIQTALRSDFDTFNKVMPGKLFFEVACEELGVSPSTYLAIVTKLLLESRGSVEPDNIALQLQHYLPDRSK